MPHLPIKRDTGKMTLSAQMQRQVMLKAMVDLMTNLAQIRPLAIIFDELQNVDLGSMTLALALRNRGVQNVALFGALLPSALLEAVRRQNSLGIFISVVKSASFFREFDIPPLTKEETQEMIAAILPGLATRPELSEMIWSASGGNPLFIQAHLKSLIAQGQISVRDGVLTLELPTGVKSFQNAEEAVASNLAALDPETKELVTDAAVAGPVVELQLLQAIAGLNEGQTQEILDKAQRAAILAMSEEEGDRVKFASETVREVTYLQADEGRRRRTHGQIGELVEQQHKDNPDAVAAELAYHYGRSDRVEKATEYQSRVKALGRAIFDTSETMLMASKKVARKIPESERMLSSSSAGKVVPFARAFIEAVAKTRVAAAPDVGRAEAQAVRMQLNFILDNDDPLTLSVEGETLIANALTIAGNLEDKTPQELRQLLLGHNAKSLTFQMGVDEREIELLLNALARRVDVHVGFLWPIWLGENQIRNIYIEQEVQTARLIREGEGAVVSFSGMGAGAAAAKASGPAVAEAEGAAEPQRRVKKPGARPASKALSDEGVAHFVKFPVAGITSKRVREELLVAFEAAMAAGDRDALQSLVDSLKVCLTDASIEVRLYAGGLMEAVLPRCVTHKCEYLEDMMVGILCEVLAREQDARAYGRLARIACEAASRTLQREDYDAVRRLVTAFSRFDPVSGGRGIRAQQLSAIQHLLNSAFFDLLMDDLTSGDPTRTSAANFVLASFEDLVVPRVVRALTESDSLRMRLAVVSVLKSQISATLPHIKEQLLTNANATALKRIVSVIGELLPGSRELIQTVLDHPSEDLATEAVSAFLKLPAPECAAEIAALLKHPRAIIRLEALRVIGDTKIAEGEEAVRQMLSSSSEEVRREVCITLGKLGSTRSVPELCRILRRRGFFGLFGGAPPAVRGAAAWALGQIRDQRALPYLRKAASDRNAIVQATAKLALQTFETS
jgi:HEAT repeat protein